MSEGTETRHISGERREYEGLFFELRNFGTPTYSVTRRFDTSPQRDYIDESPVIESINISFFFSSPNSFSLGRIRVPYKRLDRRHRLPLVRERSRRRMKRSPHVRAVTCAWFIEDKVPVGPGGGRG